VTQKAAVTVSIGFMLPAFLRKNSDTVTTDFICHKPGKHNEGIKKYVKITRMTLQQVWLLNSPVPVMSGQIIVLGIKTIFRLRIF